MDLERVGSNVGPTSANAVSMAAQGLPAGPASPPRLRAGVVDLGRCPRAGAPARLSARLSSSAVAGSDGDVGARKGQSNGPAGSHSSGRRPQSLLTDMALVGRFDKQASIFWPRKCLMEVA